MAELTPRSVDQTTRIAAPSWTAIGQELHCLEVGPRVYAHSASGSLYAEAVRTSDLIDGRSIRPIVNPTKSCSPRGSPCKPRWRDLTLYSPQYPPLTEAFQSLSDGHITTDLDHSIHTLHPVSSLAGHYHSITVQAERSLYLLATILPRNTSDRLAHLLSIHHGRHRHHHAISNPPQAHSIPAPHPLHLSSPRPAGADCRARCDQRALLPSLCGVGASFSAAAEARWLYKVSKLNCHAI